ncbi:MAG: hypothetical protein PHS14_12165 [Elusimicrobia bacterium]|nr:hypothetical protein [Elusimicrobiota bacterium]
MNIITMLAPVLGASLFINAYAARKDSPRTDLTAAVNAGLTLEVRQRALSALTGKPGPGPCQYKNIGPLILAATNTKDGFSGALLEAAETLMTRCKVEEGRTIDDSALTSALIQCSDPKVGDVEVRYWALKALALTKFPNPSITQAFLRSARQDTAARNRVAALNNIGYKNSGVPDQQIADVLTAASDPAHESEAWVRTRALAMMTAQLWRGNLPASLLANLNRGMTADPDPHVRKFSATYLLQTGDPHAGELFERALGQEKVAEVRDEIKKNLEVLERAHQAR